MALKELGAFGVIYPMMRDESAYAMGGGTYVLSTDGTRIVAVIFEAPKTGTIVGADAIIQAVGNVANNGLQIGQMGISAGLPDGTFVRSVTSAANTPASTGLWAPGDWDTSIAVVRGDPICIAIKNPSFTTGDSVTVGHMTLTTDIHFPMGCYGANGATKASFSVPMIFPRYSDGSYGFVSRENPCASTVTDVTINTGSAYNEIGNAFVLPVPMRCRGVMFHAKNLLTESFDVVLYGPAEQVIATHTVPAYYNTGSGNRYFQRYWAQDIDLSQGVPYAVTLKPSSASNQVMTFYDIYPNEAAMRDTVDAGLNVYKVTRAGAGFTSYNAASPGYRRMRLSLLVSAFDDGKVGPRTRSLRKV